MYSCIDAQITDVISLVQLFCQVVQSHRLIQKWHIAKPSLKVGGAYTHSTYLNLSDMHMYASTKAHSQ